MYRGLVVLLNLKHPGQSAMANLEDQQNIFQYGTGNVLEFDKIVKCPGKCIVDGNYRKPPFYCTYFLTLPQ